MNLVEEHAVETGPLDGLVEVRVVEAEEQRDVSAGTRGREYRVWYLTYTMAGLLPPSSRVTDSARGQAEEDDVMRSAFAHARSGSLGRPD